MKHRLSDGAGVLEIDHRNSPGLTPADVAGVPGAVAVPGGALMERDILNCSHCQRGVLLNPGRVRARAVCPKCYAFICDGCERARVQSGGACVPFKQVLDRAHEVVEKFVGDPDHPGAAMDLETLSQPAAARVVLASSW